MRVNSYTSNSNNKRFIWLKLIVFLIILGYLLHQIGEYFEDISKKNEIVSNYRRAWEEFYELEPNSLDLIYIGSSHAYCTFDPEIIDNALGTNSFNFGSPLQHPDATYYVLKEVLKYHKPEMVVFEVYWDMLDDEFDLKQADTVISAIGSRDFEREFIKEVFPINEMVKYYFKPVRYQQDVFNYWNKEFVEDFEEEHDVELLNTDTEAIAGVSRHKGRGFIYSDIIMPSSEFYEKNQFVGLDGDEWVFNEAQKEYVEKIVKLARENDIEIVFVTAPIATISMEHIVNYDGIHNKIANLAKELDVPYLDYNMVNMEENMLENKNFRDDAHLNFSGVEIVMEHFVEWILIN